MRDVAGESIMLSESHACLKSKDSIGDFSYRSHPHGIKVTFGNPFQKNAVHTGAETRHHAVGEIDVGPGIQ